ncbi:tRNA pseudouridine(55) synthase TruB [Mesosutterella sp. OilRF-GAM-744-9]|uniref:tRNA pseudouridine synthase B n=1 Tax=Mesosutterella porci TaxID=2915351 RepID=A0ABS9MUQ8_9BURK|nr:tRNA pseudouridine(55) synthase TruB [Mesosutterella sp. oilRF-744-WT-GAM-9]MCG5031748.1 tRNA pseudouridine(55) synthase TruB [Mesosutterella sp. oilRF-744-WT-GAM-9]
MNGVLLLRKPGGVSSNHALQGARRLLNAAKAGHCGTLDPLATGLLPIAFGEATKFSSDLLDADKAYEAEARLGEVTDTGDVTGAVLERHAVNVGLEAMRQAASRLTGDIKQVPPMYSALKRDGVALYRLAREGKTVEREPRSVRIYSFRVVSEENGLVKLHCEVSKGTYIRTLIEDWGRILGCGATMAALCRTRVGSLRLDDAVTLEELEKLPGPRERAAMLRPPDALIQALEPVELSAEDELRLKNGQRLALHLPNRGRVRVYGPGSRLLGTALVNERGVLAPERLIATN